MSPSRKKLFLIAGIILAALIILPPTVILPCVVRSMEVPQRQLLADIDSDKILFTRTLPPGNYFRFFISVPRGRTLLAPMSASVSIKEAGRVVIECPLGSATMEQAGNIGAADGVSYYPLNWPENTGAGTKGILRGRHKYDFEFRFSESPPAGSSLWIAWLQRGSD